MRISDWSSDVCSSDLPFAKQMVEGRQPRAISPSVSASRCHLPMPAAQGGSCYPTRVQVTVRQNTDTKPFIVNLLPFKLGRASCRERVCQTVYISMFALTLKKKKPNINNHSTNN